ncbi:hypothetical protein GCM10028777_35470 [Angustibacter speluncae]
MTNPWSPPTAVLPQAAATPARAPAPVAYGGYAPPAPPPPPARGGAGLAVAALVLSVLALLGVIGLGVFVVGSGLAGGVDPGYELEGTLPQAEPGRVYTPDEVRTEVEQVLEADWSTHEDLRCEELVFEEGASTSCTGVVDGLDTEIEVDVVDEVGHFVLAQYW